MRRALVLLVVLLATSLIGVRPSQAQFATCDHAYVATWDVAASGGSPAWSAGTIECVEYFRFSLRTPHGERWIRGIGDVNLDTMITPGAVRAIERGAQRAAQRFAALGEYNIENTTILMSFSTAESLANEPASGRTAAWTMAGHGTTPATQECRITMFLLDDYSVDVELPHAVAHELFHCVESGSLTVAQFEARGRADNWWIEGAAELFAAVVVGNDNVRWDRARQFREAVEEEAPVYRMGYAAAVLFWWMYDQYGLEALMPLLREAPESGYPGAQRRYLREAFDDGEWLQFVKAYTNGTIRYPGMSTSRLSAPDGEIWSIDANETRRLALEPFVITLGWANYGCGRWGNSVNSANAETRQGESWQRWPAETDSRAGGTRYRVAAMHTGEEPGELTLRVERRETCRPCMEASVIDRCLVGVWRQSGGGPLEYLRRRGVPITAAAISPLELSMNDDGTFSTGSVGMDVEMQTADNHGHVMRGEGAGTTDATRGRWSAEDGALHGCFDSGGQATGNTRLEAEGHVRNSPWNGGSMAGVSGGTTYTCSDSTFTTSSPTRYGPMTYQFSRVTPPPGH